MIIEVHDYGVSPSFRNLSAEIYKNVSKDMKGFPPKCDLHLCRDTVGFLRLQQIQINKLAQKIGSPVLPILMSLGVSTTLLFKYPETHLEENYIKSYVESLEELEGLIAHEVGKASYLFKNKMLSFSGKLTSSLKDCIYLMKSDYEAENNAVETGYHSGILAKQIGQLNSWKKEEEIIDYSAFCSQIKLVAEHAAFMQSDKPPKQQKELIGRLWNEYSGTREFEASLRLLQSKELRESPERFGDEKFLEDFLIEKHRGWGFCNCSPDYGS